ncbi:MAG: glycosyltransferase [Acidobacteriaceae bacterium]|jgi:colanic acid/amylovoran biosynthesis glycosyltransferase
MNDFTRSCECPRVIIFRSTLLPLSETFIRDQAEALRRFEPIYAGLKQARSGLPRSQRSILLTSPSTRFPRLRILAYKATGYSPAFKSQIGEVQPSLLHAHFAVDGALALPLAKSLDIPLIVTLHGYDVTTNDANMRKSLSGILYLLKRRELWERTHTFLCVSEFIRTKAVEAGFPPHKLRAHYTGIDCNYFSRSGGPRDGGVLFAGRLVQKKGCQYLLDAMVEVSRSIPETHLTVIGDGPLRSSLEAHARQLGLRVRFLGALPTSEVRAYMSRASIFCVPSLRADNGDSEGFGMVFTEAQAMGTPVVSFNHGGIPEAVEDGRTGLLVPERDTPALAAAILRLLRDTNLWNDFSVHASERIRERYALDRQTRSLEDIYAAISNTPVCNTPAIALS